MNSRTLPKAPEEEVEAMEKDYFKTKFHDMLKDWRLYLLFLPLLFFLICWKYFPIGSMISAFKNLTIDSSFGGGSYTSLWVGFQPFQYLFSQAAFWSAFRNTFVLSFYGLVFGFPFPIILALFFSEIRFTAYRSVTQVFTYLPKFISTVVMTSLIGLLFQSSTPSVSAGVFGAFFENCFGLKNLVSDPKAFRSIFIISGIWTEAGYGSIVYFAAILGISPTNYEAAKIDGANKWQQIRYVTFPGMAPTLIIMLILKIGTLLTVGYEKVYLMQQLGITGATYETSQTVSTYVINIIMKQANINQGIGSAADLFNSLLSMLLVLGSNRVARKVSSTSLF
jgi:putative aldouronate transport system permease protein